MPQGGARAQKLLLYEIGKSTDMGYTGYSRRFFLLLVFKYVLLFVLLGESNISFHFLRK